MSGSRRLEVSESMSTKKCPFCAEEIKAEAVVCKHCSRDLVKKPKEERLGKASLRKSLAEQAQGFKKEVRKIGPGAGVEKTKKCPFCAEEILAEAIFCKHCQQMLSGTRSRKDRKQAKRPKWRESFWPSVDTAEGAALAAKQGFWAVLICTVVTAAFALLSIMGFDPSALVDAALFAIIAWGLWNKSRFAAVSGLLLYVIERLYMWSTVGIQNPVIPVLFTLFFISGVRGTFAWKRLKTGTATTPNP